MQIDDVPQHKKNFKDGDKAPRKKMFVLSKDGSYTSTMSDGWEVENLALEEAWNDIEHQLALAKSDVLQGKKSPIHFHLIRCRMDIAILASYVGKWQWQVKRHLSPKVFDALSTKMKQRYADAFDISLEQLSKIE